MGLELSLFWHFLSELKKIFFLSSQTTFNGTFNLLFFWIVSPLYHLKQIKIGFNYKALKRLESCENSLLLWPFR